MTHGQAEIAPLCTALGVGTEIQAFHESDVIEDPEQVRIQVGLTGGLSPPALHGPFGYLFPARELLLERGGRASPPRNGTLLIPDILATLMEYAPNAV